MRLSSLSSRIGFGGIKLFRRNPYCRYRTSIDPIGLVSLKRFHRRRVHQQQIQLWVAPFQNVPDWDPVDPGRFHCYVFDSMCPEPFPQPFQILSKRAEKPLLRFEAHASPNPLPNADTDGLQARPDHIHKQAPETVDGLCSLPAIAD